MLVANNIDEFIESLKILKKVEQETKNRQEELEKYFDIEKGFWKEVYNEYEEED